jgi:hypothetical protein
VVDERSADGAAHAGSTGRSHTRGTTGRSAGLLHAVRLPSGVRRFRPEDVEAMRQQMFSGFAPMRADENIVSARARSLN